MFFQIIFLNFKLIINISLFILIISNFVQNGKMQLKIFIKMIICIYFVCILPFQYKLLINDFISNYQNLNKKKESCCEL